MNFSLKAFLITALVAMTFLCNENLYSRDSSYVYKTNLIIGHFNDDAENDTLVAVAKQDKMFYPKYIAWGDSQNILNDTTLFVYPSWEKLKVRCSYDFLNNDELIDLTFIVWGKLEINDTTFKDTSMAFVIFGRNSLDTLQSFNLAEVDSVQTEPFIAMSLIMGIQLTDCQVRNTSYKPSYVLNNMEINFGNERKSLIYADSMSVKVFPNPALYYVNIELNNISQGRYTFQIMSLQGNLVEEQNVEIAQTGNINRILNLKDVATGFYYLRILKETNAIGTYPLIVVH